MKVTLGLLAAALLVMTGCDKEDFQTKPKIEVLSVEPGQVPIGQRLLVRLAFTDKEGDVDDSVTVIRTRINRRDLTQRPFTLRFKIPAFPDKSKGEMDISMPWSTALTLQSPPLRIPGQNVNEPDTLTFRFSVLDAKGNRSDTVALGSNVVVIR